ncbi:MAG: hypothetical protein F4Y03_16105 [Alphaproteobacteria bacterium]|nr:hypothetical protein [Alphaproteobacteria bacterium]
MTDTPPEIWAWAGPGGRFWRPTAAEAHGVGAKRYVLGTEFDRVKEERDRLLAGATVVIECKDLGLAITLPVLEELRAVVEKCKGEERD